MRPKDIASLIYRIEESNSGSDYRCLGISAWPVIRNSVFSILEDKSTTPVVKKHFFVRLFCSFLVFVSSAFKIKRGRAILLTDFKFSQDVNGKQYYKEFEALSCLPANREQGIVLAIAGRAPTASSISNSVISFEFLKIVASILSRLFCTIYMSAALRNKIDAILSQLPDEYLAPVSRELLARKVINNILFVAICCFFVRIYIAFAKPDKAYVVCCYSLFNMAFCAACRKQNIDVVDIQHGVSGKYHRAYGFWRSEGGVLPDTLPNEYWVWSKKDYAQISNWCNRESSSSVYLKGNIWRDFFFQSGLYEESLGEWNQFIDQLAGYDKKVVITLQDASLSPLFLKLLKTAPMQWAFLIRAHPDSAESFSALDIMMLPNVYFIEPSKMPIQALMKVADVNITRWSASVYDAFMEGVPSIVTTEHGRDYFDDFIKDGLAFFSNDCLKIIQLISDSKKVHPIDPGKVI